MLDFGTTAIISILFLVDPPGTVPAFIALTAQQSAEKRRNTALVASLTTTLTLAGFAEHGARRLGPGQGRRRRRILTTTG